MITERETPQTAASGPDDELAHKFSGYARHRISSFRYDATGDPALLHQYAMLCNNIFNRFAGLSAGDDRAAFSSLAVQDRQCLGGVQAIISSPKNAHQLPCERQGFSLQKCLPELDLYNVVYGEILDFVALPEYQESIITEELLHHLVNQAIGQGVQYLFTVSTMSHANRYRQAAQLFGLYCTLRSDLDLPDYDEFAGGRAFLTVLDLTMLESGLDTTRSKEGLHA